MARSIEAAHSLRRQSRTWVSTRLAGFAVVALLATEPVAGAGLGEWVPLGGPLGGVVSSVALDPANPATLYAASNSRILESSDGGATWAAVAVLPVRSLAVGGGVPSVVFAFDPGFYRSLDGGATWTELAVTGQDEDVHAVAIDPLDPQVVYTALTSFGLPPIWKSTDGGDTWVPVGFGVPTSRILVVDPLVPTTLFAGSVEFGVYKTENGGDSWAPVNTGLTDLSILALAVAPSSPSTLYALTGSGLFRTTDGGAMWSLRSAVDGGALAVHPTDPATVYRGDPNFGVFKSTDGGLIWTDAYSGLDSRAVFALAIDPLVSDNLYAGTAFGVYASVDGAAGWEPRLGGFVAVTPTSVAGDPSTPDVVYAASGPGGLFKSLDGGSTWNRANSGISDLAIGGSAGPLAVATTVPQTLYAGACVDAGFVISDDGAQTWAPADAGMDGCAESFDVAPSNPLTLIARTASGLFSSVDGAGSWIEVGVGTPIEGVFVSDLAFDPQAATTLYAAVPDPLTTSGGVFKSTNGGFAWARAGTLRDAVLLAIDPAVPETLYASGTFGSFDKSLDGGSTWNPTGSSPGRLRALIVDPVTSSVLYAALVNGGVARTSDGGDHWRDLHDGLTLDGGITLARASSLLIDPHDPETVYAGVVGGGLFSIDLELTIFTDGFETGDTSAWSSVSP